MYTRGKWIHLHTPDSKVEEGKAHSVLRAGDAPVFPPGAVSKDGRFPYPPPTLSRENGRKLLQVSCPLGMCET